MTHTHYAGMGMCAQCNPGWHLIPGPSNAIVGCDDCGHLHGEHSREPGIGCLHWDGARVWCPCGRAGGSEADQ